MNIKQNKYGGKYMERSSRTSQGYKLESQIREAYGRVTYTQTWHEKKIKRLLIINEKSLYVRRNNIFNL